MDGARESAVGRRARVAHLPRRTARAMYVFAACVCVCPRITLFLFCSFAVVASRVTADDAVLSRARSRLQSLRNVLTCVDQHKAAVDAHWRRAAPALPLPPVAGGAGEGALAALFLLGDAPESCSATLSAALDAVGAAVAAALDGADAASSGAADLVRAVHRARANWADFCMRRAAANVADDARVEAQLEAAGARVATALQLCVQRAHELGREATNLPAAAGIAAAFARADPFADEEEAPPAAAADPATADEAEAGDGVALAEHQRLARLLAALDLREAAAALGTLCTEAARLGAVAPRRVREWVRGAAGPLRELSRQAAAASLGAAVQLVRFHRAVCKLNYVVLAVANKLLAVGYCRRPEDPPGGDGDGDLEDDVEGTGMGACGCVVAFSAPGVWSLMFSVVRCRRGRGQARCERRNRG